MLKLEQTMMYWLQNACESSIIMAGCWRTSSGTSRQCLAVCCVACGTRRDASPMKSKVTSSTLSSQLKSGQQVGNVWPEKKHRKTKPGNCSAIALLSYRLSRALSFSLSHSPPADNEWLSGPTTSAPVLIVIYTAAAVPEANYYHSLLNSLSDFLFTHKSVSHISLYLYLPLFFLQECILQRHRYIW